MEQFFTEEISSYHECKNPVSKMKLKTFLNKTAKIIEYEWNNNAFYYKVKIITLFFIM